MIEKCESLTGADATAIVLVQKLNEVIDILNSPVRDVPHRRVPTNADHAQAMDMILQRFATGPYAAISQSEPNELAATIGVALENLQAAVKKYKESLAG